MKFFIFVYVYIWKRHLQESLRVFLTLDLTFFLTDTVLTTLPENSSAYYFISGIILEFIEFYAIQTIRTFCEFSIENSTALSLYIFATCLLLS